jgi:hypothetical protein
MRFVRLRKTIEQHLDNEPPVVEARPRRNVATYAPPAKPVTGEKRKSSIGSISDGLEVDTSSDERQESTEPPKKRQARTKRSSHKENTSPSQPIKTCHLVESTSPQPLNNSSFAPSDEAASISSAGAQLQTSLLLDLEARTMDNVSAVSLRPSDSISEVIQRAYLAELEEERWDQAPEGEFALAMLMICINVGRSRGDRRSFCVLVSRAEVNEAEFWVLQ